MKFLIDYFNLNKRISIPMAHMPSVGLPYKIESMPSQPPAAEPPPETPMSIGEQILMYVGAVIGVLFSSVVSKFDAGSSIAGFNFTAATIAVSAIVALIIIPIVFEKLSIKPNTPLLARLGLFVQHGVFWHILLGAIGKTLAS